MGGEFCPAGTVGGQQRLAQLPSCLQDDCLIVMLAYAALEQPPADAPAAQLQVVLYTA